MYGFSPRDISDLALLRILYDFHDHSTIMRIHQFVWGISLLSLTEAHKGHRRRSTPSSSQALNQTLTNIIPNAAGGPALYYNGSGPVPSYNETSPTPAPLPTLG
jgi:sphingomyelin phosphodiesterase